MRRHSDTVFQITFTIRAVQNPARLPEFMARLNLVQTTAKGVAGSFSGVINNRNIINSNIDIIRKSYEAERIRNIVPDGTVPFQAEPAQQTSGVALEFK